MLSLAWKTVKRYNIKVILLLPELDKKIFSGLWSSIRQFQVSTKSLESINWSLLIKWLLTRGYFTLQTWNRACLCVYAKGPYKVVSVVRKLSYCCRKGRECILHWSPDNERRRSIRNRTIRRTCFAYTTSTRSYESVLKDKSGLNWRQGLNQKRDWIIFQLADILV